ncbi:MAG: SRPBCC domain-containing protein [Anaerolineales bacterium]|nr:SRPBCC domain-containing protein [Anaerolineales bacterium]
MTDQGGKQLTVATPLDRVWAALTGPAAPGAWVGGAGGVAFDRRVGGAYQVFGGAPAGVLRSLRYPAELEYAWRPDEWEPERPDSVVRWACAPDGDRPTVCPAQLGYPNEAERDRYADDWDRYWLEPLQVWLEAEVVEEA